VYGKNIKVQGSSLGKRKGENYEVTALMGAQKTKKGGISVRVGEVGVAGMGQVMISGLGARRRTGTAAP